MKGIIRKLSLVIFLILHFEDFVICTEKRSFCFMLYWLFLYLKWYQCPTTPRAFSIPALKNKPFLSPWFPQKAKRKSIVRSLEIQIHYRGLNIEFEHVTSAYSFVVCFGRENYMAWHENEQKLSIYVNSESKLPEDISAKNGLCQLILDIFVDSFSSQLKYCLSSLNIKINSRVYNFPDSKNFWKENILSDNLQLNWHFSRL